SRPQRRRATPARRRRRTPALRPRNSVPAGESSPAPHVSRRSAPGTAGDRRTRTRQRPAASSTQLGLSRRIAPPGTARRRSPGRATAGRGGTGHQPGAAALRPPAGVPTFSCPAVIRTEELGSAPARFAVIVRSELAWVGTGIAGAEGRGLVAAPCRHPTRLLRVDDLAGGWIESMPRPVERVVRWKAAADPPVQAESQQEQAGHEAEDDVAHAEVEDVGRGPEYGKVHEPGQQEQHPDDGVELGGDVSADDGAGDEDQADED